MTPREALEVVSFGVLISLAEARAPCITAGIAIPDPLELHARVAGSVSLLLAARHDRGFRGRVPDIPNSAAGFIGEQGAKVLCPSLKPKARAASYVHLPEPAGAAIAAISATRSPDLDE